MYLRLGDDLLEVLERFLIIDKTHKPKLKIIHCNYVNVLLGGPVCILTWVSSADFSKWNQDLHKNKTRNEDFSQE